MCILCIYIYIYQFAMENPPFQMEKLPSRDLSKLLGMYGGLMGILWKIQGSIKSINIGVSKRTSQR